MFFFNNYFYFITIALQAICVIHCLRKGNQTNWIWLIVFLPFIGCLIYLFTEIFTRRDVQKMQSGMGAMLNPTGSIKKLERELHFTDTFTNRISLADAYLAGGQTTKAIELYEKSLTGTFSENEHILYQLTIAYFQNNRFEDAVVTAKKIYGRPQFARSKAHILYAIALSYTNNKEAAEKEFKTMQGRFANFEARYQYGLFLQRNNQAAEAKQLFNQIIEEGTQLSSRERNYNRDWFRLAKDELRKP